MDISRATVFSGEEHLSKVLDTIMRTGTAVFVTKEGKLFGLIDDRNVRSNFSDPSNVRCDTASVKCPSLKEDAHVLDILDAFLSGHFKSLPVLDSSEKIIGSVSRTDLLGELHNLNLIPGGLAEQYMSSPVYTIDENNTISEAKALMNKKGVHHLAVMHNSSISGILSTFDFMGLALSPKGRQSYQLISVVKDFGSRKVGEIARSPISVGNDLTLVQAVMKMKEKGVSSILVVDDKKPIGMLSATDIFKKIRAMLEPKLDLIVSGLDDDTLIYHEEIKSSVLSALSKFQGTFVFDSPSVQVKRGKSVYIIHVHLKIDNKPVAISSEGYKIGDTMMAINHQIKAVLDKVKGEKLGMKKVDRVDE
ncbi:CBS domain-containing protein [Candidatus Micrarchaeota archaeon]|nr:CBS domain-containing protein [Candidatus Micrarchaeota archaeon]